MLPVNQNLSSTQGSGKSGRAARIISVQEKTLKIIPLEISQNCFSTLEGLSFFSFISLMFKIDDWNYAAVAWLIKMHSILAYLNIIPTMTTSSSLPFR